MRKTGKLLVMNQLRVSELRPLWRRSFSHFMTAMGWEVLPSILRFRPNAVETTAMRPAPCLEDKPSQLPNLGLCACLNFRMD